MLGKEGGAHIVNPFLEAVGFKLSGMRPIPKGECDYSKQARINYENWKDLEKLASGVPTMLNVEVASSPHYQEFLKDPTLWKPMELIAKK